MVWITVDDKEDDDNVTFDVVRNCVPPKQLEAVKASTLLHHLSRLSIFSRASSIRLSGIVCVLGSASREPKVLEEMIESGMNIACLNFAHGSHAYHSQVLDNIKEAVGNCSRKFGVPCSVGVALATKGSHLRTSFIVGNQMEVSVGPGDIVELTGDAEYVLNENSPNLVHINCDNLHEKLQVGNKIYIDDQKVVLVVTTIKSPVVICKVVKGRDVRSRKRVYIPDVLLDLPALSNKDVDDLKFAVINNLDMIFASYVRSADAVRQIRGILGPEGEKILVISQIEDSQAMKNIDRIIQASDGIIISRQSLRNEIGEERLVLAQKSIISKCNQVGKPVICTTQVWDPSLKNLKPTCAESYDVANAVLDGADCILLRHETIRGDHPVKSIQIASNICKQAEAAVWQKQLVVELSDKINPPVTAVQAVAASAVQVSLNLLASAIVVVTSSLTSAQLLTKYRPKCPIIAVTRNRQAARQAHLFKGIIPLQYKTEMANPWDKDLNLRIYHGINFGRKKGFIQTGDPVVILMASRQGAGFTDKMMVLYVTKHISHGTVCTC